MKINQKGYYEEHGDGHHTDIGLKNSLLTIMDDMESVVDFGCGDASYIKNIGSTLNIKVRAFDGNPNVVDITDGIGEQLDLSEPFTLNETFNVVMSLEVAEHIPKKYEEIYVNNLIKHTDKYLVISWAIPGQASIEKGHVNEQPNEYVLNLFEGLGFTHLEEHSQYLRSSITNLNWFKNTIFVFEKEL